MFVRRLVPIEAAPACQSTYGCPDLWEMADGDFAVIGEDITSLAGHLPAGAGCSQGEAIVRIPRTLLIRAKPAIPNRI